MKNKHKMLMESTFNFQKFKNLINLKKNLRLIVYTIIYYIIITLIV